MRSVGRRAGGETAARPPPARLARPEVAEAIRGVDRPPGMTDDQLRRVIRASYIAHGLPAEGAPAVPADVARRLARIGDRVDRNLADAERHRGRALSPEERAAYLAWVYESPGSMEARALLGDRTERLSRPVREDETYGRPGDAGEITTAPLSADEAAEVEAIAAEEERPGAR